MGRVRLRESLPAMATQTWGQSLHDALHEKRHVAAPESASYRRLQSRDEEPRI